MTSPRFPTRVAGALAAFLAASAVSAAGAQASTFCVLAPGCGGTDVDGLQQALDLAAGAAGDDRVELGPGTFTTPKGFTYAGAATEGALELVGSGPETVVAADGPNKAAPFAVLSLVGGEKAAVVVRGLRVVTPTRADAGGLVRGLALERATGEDLSVGQAPGALGTTAGVAIGDGATLRSSQVTAADTPNTAAVTMSGDGSRLADSEVAGGTWGVKAFADAVADVTRTRVAVTAAGEHAVLCHGCAKLAVDSSVLRVAGAATGLTALGLVNRHAAVDASHLTIAGNGAGASVGVMAAAAPGTAAPATLRIDNSILHGVAHALVRSGYPAGSPAALTAVRSNYDPSGDLGGGPGVLGQELRTTLDPHFVDAAGGDLPLARDSQLIDLGRTDGRFVASESALGGLPRDVDGDWVPGAKPDLGAYEYQASVPVARIGGALSVPAGVPVALDGAARPTPTPASS